MSGDGPLVVTGTDGTRYRVEVYGTNSQQLTVTDTAVAQAAAQTLFNEAGVAQHDQPEVVVQIAQSQAEATVALAKGTTTLNSEAIATSVRSMSGAVRAPTPEELVALLTSPSPASRGTPLFASFDAVDTPPPAPADTPPPEPATIPPPPAPLPPTLSDTDAPPVGINRYDHAYSRETNRCWANATLQAIFHAFPMNVLSVVEKPEKTETEDELRQNLQYQLFRLYVDYQQGKTITHKRRDVVVQAAETLRQAIGGQEESWATTKKHDAQEFFDFLVEEALGPADDRLKLNGFTVGDNSHVVQIDRRVEGKGVASALIASGNNKIDVISGDHNPDVLSLRFNPSNIVINPSMFIDKRRKGTADDWDRLYQFRAGIAHAGNHYVTYVRRGAKYYRCDDNKVTEVAESEVRRALAHPYILSYGRIDNNEQTV